MTEQQTITERKREQIRARQQAMRNQLPAKIEMIRERQRQIREQQRQIQERYSHRRTIEDKHS